MTEPMRWTRKGKAPNCFYVSGHWSIVRKPARSRTGRQLRRKDWALYRGGVYVAGKCWSMAPLKDLAEDLERVAGDRAGIEGALVGYVSPMAARATATSILRR